jgi:hypothetical protein
MGSKSGKKNAPSLRTRRPDNIPWNVKPVPSRVVAVGDVHGDIEGLACILLDRGLVDKDGRWAGGNTHLVLNGDLVGGKYARLLLQFIMRLEAEARAAGGAVYPLLGNHDIQVFQKEYQKRVGKTMFQKYQVQGAKEGGIAEAFRGETALARWLRERNAVIRIGPVLFTHAGLNLWAARHHVKRMNATIRAWIRYWQGMDSQPDKRTQWAALGPDADWSGPSTGPLWTRAYKVKKGKKSKRRKAKRGGAPEPEQLDRLLGRYRARRMVIGHAPVGGKEVLLSHPFYGPRVVMIDSRISDKKGGQLSCVEVRGDAVTAHYVKRSSRGTRIRERELKALKNKSAGRT